MLLTKTCPCFRLLYLRTTKKPHSPRSWRVCWRFRKPGDRPRQRLLHRRDTGDRRPVGCGEPQDQSRPPSVNRGKTEALKTGFALTTGQIVIVQDADLEYDPAEIADVIAPIVEGHADVVYGSRFLVRKASRVLYFYHYIANKGLTFLSNLCTNVNMTDVETCYKAFRGEIIRNMTITSSGFGFEIEVTAKVAKLGVSIYEVPISYHGRTYEQGKKIGMKDGIAALWYIVRFNFFCSLKDSFRVLPEAGSAQRAAREKGR